MLKLYKRFVSPILELTFGHACRFTPTCSEYMDGAIAKYGIIKGGFLGIKRIVRCNPLSKSGYDPIV